MGLLKNFSSFQGLSFKFCFTFINNGCLIILSLTMKNLNRKGILQRIVTVVFVCVW